ncbi:Heterogeneous nuclear ribonucleoprotein A1-like 2, partial [Galemys pyrenaicus]
RSPSTAILSKSVSKELEQLCELFLGGLNFETTDESPRSCSEPWRCSDCCARATHPAIQRLWEELQDQTVLLREESQTPGAHCTMASKLNNRTQRNVTIPKYNIESPKKKTFVGIIDENTDKYHLGDDFEQCGKIDVLKIMTDGGHGRSRGFTLVVLGTLVVFVEEALVGMTTLVMEETSVDKVALVAAMEQAGEESQRGDGEDTGYNKFVNSAKHGGGRASLLQRRCVLDNTHVYGPKT